MLKTKLVKMVKSKSFQLLTIKYDTLSNGKVVARNLPGEIAQVPVDEQETYLRTKLQYK